MKPFLQDPWINLSTELLTFHIDHTKQYLQLVKALYGTPHVSRKKLAYTDSENHIL